MKLIPKKQWGGIAVPAEQQRQESSAFLDGKLREVGKIAQEADRRIAHKRQVIGRHPKNRSTDKVVEFQEKLFDGGYFGKEEKQNTPITFMPQIIDEIENRRFVPYPVSSNKNEQAVSDHKVNSGVEEPYWILDRQKGTLSHKTKDKTLRTFRVMTGLSKNEDGYNFIRLSEKVRIRITMI